MDGIYLKRSWGGSYENVAVMVAIGVNDDGYREVIGVDGKVFYRRCGKDSFQVHGNDFFLTRDKE